MNTLELARFCAAEDHPRSYMHKPFTRGAYTWATNGHILVRVPALADVPEDKPSPDIVEYTWNKVPEPKEWHPVPEVKMPKPVECVDCGGTRESECFHCGHVGKCENCDGTGTVMPRPLSIKIGGAQFADRYLALIQGWEIALTGPETAAWIRHDDALGLLMPMRM